MHMQFLMHSVQIWFKFNYIYNFMYVHLYDNIGSNSSYVYNYTYVDLYVYK